MNKLEKAIEMALDAHEGDTDKAGATYIRHPLRLMGEMETEQERIVAVLHDVVEDSDYELREIEETFGTDIADAIEALTKPKDNVNYVTEYIPKVAENDTARKVKQADLRDNLDVTRLPEVSQEDFENIQKYHRSLKKLTKSEGSSR
jgi:GTP pyrophosphokinase